jgi:large subunit ribosomal protein L32
MYLLGSWGNLPVSPDPFHRSALRADGPLRGRYTAASMAVPKKKTSKARRDKRRAQHGIEAPRLNVCPQCGSPKRPHRMCPRCHTYRGRDVEPLRTNAP